MSRDGRVVRATGGTPRDGLVSRVKEPGILCGLWTDRGYGPRLSIGITSNYGIHF